MPNVPNVVKMIQTATCVYNTTTTLTVGVSELQQFDLIDFLSDRKLISSYFDQLSIIFSRI